MIRVLILAAEGTGVLSVACGIGELLNFEAVFPVFLLSSWFWTVMLPIQIRMPSTADLLQTPQKKTSAFLTNMVQKGNYKAMSCVADCIS